MSKIIFLTGPKGSGKDTIAQIIAETYDNVKTIAFADPIKDVMMDLFELASKEQYDQFKRTDIVYKLPDHLSHPVSGRKLVREIGMLMRRYDQRQFIDYVWKEIAADPNALWIVTDMRFDDEYLMAKQLGAKIVKITRPFYNYDGHISERNFDDHLVDNILHNDGDLEYLKARIEAVMNNIMREWQ